MRSLPPQQEPFDDPIKPPRRSARLNPSPDDEPFVSLQRQKVKPEEPLWLSIEQDYMTYLELNDPWALEDDPWAIKEITDHRGAHKELLVTYQEDNKKEWVPYQKVLKDEPWLVAQYVRKHPKLKNSGQK